MTRTRPFEGGPAHAVSCLSALSGVATCRPLDHGWRGRRAAHHGGVGAETMVAPTGSAWIRLVRDGRTSLCCVHDLDPLGRAAIRRILLDDAAGALRLLGTAAAAAAPLAEGMVSDAPDAVRTRGRLLLAMTAALGACVARDPDLDVAQCIVSSAPSRPLVSFAQSGSLPAPAPSDALLSLVDGIGTVRRFTATRTWQVVEKLMPGPAPGWGDDAADGVTLVDEEDLVVEAPDALDRMRVVSRGARAAAELGIDPSTLLDEPPQ